MACKLFCKELRDIPWQYILIAQDSEKPFYVYNTVGIQIFKNAEDSGKPLYVYNTVGMQIFRNA